MNSLQVPLPAYWPLYPAHRGCAASVSTVGGGAHSPITIGLPRPSFARSSWWHGFFARDLAAGRVLRRR